MEVVKIDTEITKAFEINIQEVQAMVKKYQTLTLVPDDKESYQLCQTALTSCVRTRTGINKRRLELNKEDQNRIKKRNKAAEQLASIVAPAEDHLSGLINGEKDRLAAIEAEKARKEQEKIEARIKQLGEYRVILPYQDVAVMTDEEFDTALFDAKEEWKAEQERQAEAEAARKTEEERLEKQKAEQEAEAERLRIKDVALKAQEKAIQMEKDRIAKVDADLKAAEEAKAQAERDAKEKAEREAKEAEEKALRDAEAKKRAEALRPDKEKLIKWVKEWFLPPSYPELKSDEAINLFDNILLDLENIFKFQIERIKDL